MTEARATVDDDGGEAYVRTAGKILVLIMLACLVGILAILVVAFV